jgi:hypothetical protein
MRVALAVAVALGGCGAARQGEAVAPERPLPERLAPEGGAGGAREHKGKGPNGSIGGTRRSTGKSALPVTELLHTLKPQKGFVDTPLAFDGAGGRILYVETDGGETSELVVFDLAVAAEILRVNLAGFTTVPLQVVDADGEHVLVFARPPDDSPALAAALIHRSGRVVRSFGPATDLVRTTRDGQDAVVSYRRTEAVGQRKKPVVRHTVEVLALATGKRLGKRTTIETDPTGFSERLDFRLNHWVGGYTQAVGIKGGAYNRKEDQRSPDREGWYDLPRAAFSKVVAIPEVIEHTRRMQFLAQHPNRDHFVVPANDLDMLEVHTSDGAGRPVQLAEPFRHYLHTSLSVQDARADEPLFFSLEIDPVHPAAAAKRRAVRRSLDIYRLMPGATDATRVARLPLGAKHPGYRWRARSNRLLVVPRHVGFERGGRALEVHAIAPP